MADRDRVIALLEEQTELLRAILQALSADAPAGRGAASAVASDTDLDSQYGDPQVRSDPKRWEEGTMKGRRMSECPPAFLDLYAELLEWQAGQADAKKETTNNGAPVSKYRRADAARARGWAARIRAGKIHQAPRYVQDDSHAPPNVGPPAPGFNGSDFTPSNWRG